MGNDASTTRKRFSSRHTDDDATTTSKNDRGKLQLSDALGIIIDNLCGSVDESESSLAIQRRKSNTATNVDEDDEDLVGVGVLESDVDTVKTEEILLQSDRLLKSVDKDSIHQEDGIASHREMKKGNPSSKTQPLNVERSIDTMRGTTFCFFTKNPIGPVTPHYQGIVNIAGNTVCMLPAAMDLKGCPTICDDDLRKMEHKFPNLFMRLPDELLLSSGWTRVSKYCSFSGNPISDGSPFFHSKPGRGFYYLLASAIGMTQPTDVEPLTRDLLVLLQTDFPTQCDAAPLELIENPDEWILVDKFCFFSGGPIHPEEDVHYVANLNGTSIYMLAFLSPHLSAEELYRLNDPFNCLKTTQEVLDVEQIYALTELDFHELQIYHLGKCRELPGNLLVPKAWKKVLPRHFMVAREKALERASQHETKLKEKQGYTENGNSSPNKVINKTRNDPVPDSSMDPAPSVETVALINAKNTKELILNVVCDRPDVHEQVLDQGQMTIKDIQEEGAFARLHPLDELVCISSDNEKQISNSSTPSVQPRESQITDVMNGSPLTLHLISNSHEKLRSPSVDDWDNSITPEELLTSYIESPDALAIDYYQELSVEFDIEHSFSSLTSTHAQDAMAGDGGNDNEKILSNKEIDKDHFRLYPSPVYHTLDADYENRTSVLNKEYQHVVDDENRVTALTESPCSNETRDIDFSDEIRRDEDDDDFSDTENNHLVFREKIERNIIHNLGQEKNGRFYEKATTDPSPSSAMRVAQELLRKNRLKRQVQSSKSDDIDSISGKKVPGSNHRTLSEGESDPRIYPLPEEIQCAQEYELTDTQSDTSRSDKNSRRALILQLAKSRIKNQKALVEKSIVQRDGIS